MEKCSKGNLVKNLVSKILYADFHFRSGTNMLDISVIRILSGLLAIILFVSYILFFGVFTRKKEDPCSVRASKPTGFILMNVWLFLGSLPIIFYVLGAAVPGLVYGTPLNLSFYGADFLQLFSVFLVLFAPIIFLWSARVLGQYMRPEIEVREKHELVTKGPYSRIRHPTYTGALMVELGTILLFLNIVLIVGFLARVAMAYKRAVLEEELLSSEDGFGQAYRDYMHRTGRFLPRLARHKPLFTSGNRE